MISENEFVIMIRRQDGASQHNLPGEYLQDKRVEGELERDIPSPIATAAPIVSICAMPMTASSAPNVRRMRARVKMRRTTTAVEMTVARLRMETM